MNPKFKIMKNFIPQNAQLTSPIIARGEVSGHSHIVVGDADVYDVNGEKYIHVKGKASIKHLLEREYVEEKREVWTKEHNDIDLAPGFYKYIPQVEFDPYENEIRKVKD